MIRDITIGQYYPGNSPLHRADPRTKIIASLVYMSMVIAVRSWPAVGISAAFLAVVLFVSAIPVIYVLRGLKPVVFVIVLAALINIFSVSGNNLVSFGPLHVSDKGLETAGFMAIRLILLIGGASLLTLATPPILLTDGLETLLRPLSKIRVPVHEIAMMMTIALRFIPTLLDETDKIMKAQSARGADFETGHILERAKSFIPVLVPLFVSAFRRADDLAVAMEARCYRGAEGRTRMRQLRFGWTDLGVALAMAVFALAMVLIK